MGRERPMCLWQGETWFRGLHPAFTRAGLAVPCFKPHRELAHMVHVGLHMWQGGCTCVEVHTCRCTYTWMCMHLCVCACLQLCMWRGVHGVCKFRCGGARTWGVHAHGGA